jgi:hypothetical protein
MVHEFKVGSRYYINLDLSQEEILRITPEEYHERFFAIPSNQGLPTCQTVRHIITQGYLTLLEKCELENFDHQNCKARWMNHPFWGSITYKGYNSLVTALRGPQPQLFKCPPPHISQLASTKRTWQEEGSTISLGSKRMRREVSDP